MSNDTPQPVAPSQFERRLKYGTNVSILLIAVLAIVVLINWLAVRKAGQWPGTRIDMTASRKYTLSEQTLKVLAAMDKPVRVVTVFADGLRLDATTAKMIENFEDLLGEYEQRGEDHIKVDRINAGNAEEVEAFLGELSALYESTSAPARDAIAQGMAIYADIKTFAESQSQYLSDRMAGLQEANARAAADAQKVLEFLTNAPTTLQLEDKAKGLKGFDQSPMPNLNQAVKVAREPLDAMKAVLDEVNKRLVEPYTAASNDQYTRETYTALGQAIEPLRAKIEAAVNALGSFDLSDYNAVRSSVMGANTVIVMTDTAATSIELADVYATDTPNGTTERPTQRFRGEEAVTGSIISLLLENAPKIVFVNPGQSPAIGGSYGHVADRLLKMNFQVEEWFPAGRQTQFGPMPPQPRPTARPGQTIVWIFLAGDGRPSPAMFQAQQAMSEIIQTGDPILLHVARTAFAMPNPEDPVNKLGEKFGFTIDPTQLILTSRPDREGTLRATSAIRSDKWNEDHPIGKALAGRSVLAGSVIPISIKDGATHCAALVMSMANTWAEKNWANQQDWPEQNEDEDVGPFPLAIAAEADGQRVVVMADSNMADNQMILTQQLMPTEGRLELVEQLALPGNAELFVNSVYWLADMEELIGSGARSQDVRRIGPVTDGERKLVSWLILAGLPAAALLAGTTVWFIRRK